MQHQRRIAIFFFTAVAIVMVPPLAAQNDRTEVFASGVKGISNIGRIHTAVLSIEKGGWIVAANIREFGDAYSEVQDWQWGPLSDNGGSQAVLVGRARALGPLHVSLQTGVSSSNITRRSGEAVKRYSCENAFLFTICGNHYEMRNARQSESRTLGIPLELRVRRHTKLMGFEAGIGVDVNRIRPLFQAQAGLNIGWMPSR